MTDENGSWVSIELLGESACVLFWGDASGGSVAGVILALQSSGYDQVVCERESVCVLAVVIFF